MMKFLILAMTLFMIGCTVVETTGPDYNEEILCNYHFEDLCGNTFTVKEESMTLEKQNYYENYYGTHTTCGKYKLTYRDGCYEIVTYY